MERRSLLKWLGGFTAGLLLASQAKAQDRPSAPSSDRLGKLLPLRTLGGTGEAVTMLGVGGAHIGGMSSERDAQETIEIALEGGVRFFDTAEMYQGGGSETRYGKFLTPKYRDVVYLMTKSTARDSDTARRHLEDSLRRLNTDYLDLWQVHSVNTPEDVDNRLANGVFEVMAEAKESGKVRHLGFTGHYQPSAMLRVMEQSQIFDVCQMPVNLADPNYSSFIQQVMPKLMEQNIGVLAMKSLANGGFFGGSSHGQHGDNPKIVPNRVSIAEAINFAWSLPVSVLITGANDPEQMQEKIALANSFVAMDEQQRQNLIDKVADLAGTTVEFYKA
ncbi:aldo/keto reductase [Pleurocapsales cyanobacterium LEGE 10410]|nr:aldo/keto reductase [Pleurocapsales cyanobacterium LEGE 10410]